MNDPVALRIEAVLAKRRSRLERLELLLADWDRLIEATTMVQAALTDLATHKQATGDVRALADEAARRSSAATLKGVRSRLATLASRFARPTVNIGVSGQARVGKSTLLQSISGLGEQQIPTGDNLPVTAVRSRIFHSTSKHAFLKFHDWPSFQNLVLRPYFSRLGFGHPPNDPRSFARWQIPTDATVLTGEDPNVRRGLVDGLKGIHASFAQYEADLTGQERTVSLEELRPFVSFPSAEDQRRGVPARRYLAIREARIACPFPTLAVQNLSLIDLPGLGDFTAEGEERHVSGLQDEVDLVLFVKNSAKRSFWAPEDARALDQLQKAAAGAAMHDFVLIVVNTGGGNQGQVEALIDDITRSLNEGVSERNHRVLRCNAKDADDVNRQLLIPAIEHLAERLQTMDDGAFRLAFDESESTLASLRSFIADTRRTIERDIQARPVMREELGRRARELRQEIALEFDDLLQELRLAAEESKDVIDPAFEAAVEKCYADVRSWIGAGFNVGTAKWEKNLVGELAVERSAAGFISRELNRIRVHVANQFAGIDNTLKESVDQTIGKVAHKLRQKLKGLVGPGTGRSALETLAKTLKNASQPLIILPAALNDLLALRIEYRTYLHPVIRASLNSLDPKVGVADDPATSAKGESIVLSDRPSLAAWYHRRVVERAELAAYEARKSILREALLPPKVLFAAFEQFDDKFIRSGGALEEFERLVHSVRDQIWPGEFEQLDRAHSLVAQALAAITKTDEALSHIASIRKEDK